jgi:hypothetical protein
VHAHEDQFRALAESPLTAEQVVASHQRFTVDDKRVLDGLIVRLLAHEFVSREHVWLTLKTESPLLFEKVTWARHCVDIIRRSYRC